MSVTPKHSRRSVLTVVAAMPVASAPSLGSALDVGEPDQVFALIDAARLAMAEHVEQIRIEDAIAVKLVAERDGIDPLDPELKAANEKTAELCGISCDADDAVLNARPRTRAGVVAQLMFAAEYMARSVILSGDGPWLYDEDQILPILVNAARLIDGPLVSKIELSERLAKILSYEDQEA